jgi:hypothetical protein
MANRAPTPIPESQVRRGFAVAVLLAAVQFGIHTHSLFSLAGLAQGAHAWILDGFGHGAAGRGVVMLVFVALFAVHFLEAAVWGLYLWYKGLSPTLIEGVYFSATSITGLGYGDVVLPPPWRLLGPVMAIAGLLMFGCSTAFLFLVLEKVWSELV